MPGECEDLASNQRSPRHRNHGTRCPMPRRARPIGRLQSSGIIDGGTACRALLLCPANAQDRDWRNRHIRRADRLARRISRFRGRSPDRAPSLCQRTPDIIIPSTTEASPGEMLPLTRPRSPGVPPCMLSAANSPVVIGQCENGRLGIPAVMDSRAPSDLRADAAANTTSSAGRKISRFIRAAM